MNQHDGYQMRLEDGVYHVYLTRAFGREVPRDKQVSVFRDANRARVQPVADALNSGLTRAIGFAVAKSRTASE